MCGICGIFDTAGRAVEPNVLERMSLAIRHRGPDGSGEFARPGLALGHRRLSIIDIAGGVQPMSNEEASIHVVFNGEIYNFIELRQELEQLGYRFRTRSDTEVIVHAYAEWGTDCVRRFNGMFAFAIWDEKLTRLFLARDHLGIKPLYYTVAGTRVVFASEIKALLEHPGCSRGVNLESLADLFTFRYVPSPRTLFKGIMKLPPGHQMTVGPDGLDIKRFWTWTPAPVAPARESDLLDEYQHLLGDAVRLQLRSDVPLGLFLSSGIDSGMLLAIMKEHLPTKVQTFTIGFQGGEATNEVDDARRMAESFDADHHFEMVGPDDYKKYFERYMADIEEPLGNETAAAFYFVSKLAAQHVKVALTGQGADEPWAGYGRHLGAKLSGLYSQMPSRLTGTLGSLVARIPGRMERLKRGTSSLGERDMLTRLAKMYSFFGADVKTQLFHGALRDLHLTDCYGSRHALQWLQRDVAHLDPLTQMLFVDTRSNLPDDLLMVGDKTSMANSIEVRVPFLDYRLVQFVETLPPQLKLKGFTGKYLHKRAAEKWLPSSVVYRRKKGFANPIEHWLRTSMRPLVEDCLLSPDSGIAQYFDQRFIAQMLRQDRDGTQQYRRHIFLLLSLELWHRAYIRR